MAGVVTMTFDSGYYNQRRPGGEDQAAHRVASEIFQHDLQSAASDTRYMLQGRNSQQAEAFVRHVNQDLQRMAYENGMQGTSNHLTAMHMGNGYETVALTNGRQTRGIAQVQDTSYSPDQYDRQYPNSYPNDYSQVNRFGPNGDSASRVANEIFNGQLREASMDIRGLMQGRSGGDLSAFANAVNGRLEQIAAERGMQQERLANYLSVHQMYRNGMSGEAIAMTNGYQSRDIVAAPLNRVGMNYDRYADNGPPPGYYDQGIQQSAAYGPSWPPVENYPPPTPVYPAAYGYQRYGYGPNYGVNPGAYLGGSILRVAVGALTHGRVWF